MPAATAKPGALGQGFASAMSPWQPRPFTSPFAQASTMGPSTPPLGAAPKPLGTSAVAPGLKPPVLHGKERLAAARTAWVAKNGPHNAPGAAPGGGGVAGPTGPAVAPNGVQMPGVQADGGTPQAFPRPTVMPNDGPGAPTPGIAPGVLPPLNAPLTNSRGSVSETIRQAQTGAANQRGVNMSDVNDVKAWQATQITEAWQRVLAKHGGNTAAAMAEYNSPGWKTGYK